MKISVTPPVARDLVIKQVRKKLSEQNVELGKLRAYPNDKTPFNTQFSVNDGDTSLAIALSTPLEDKYFNNSSIVGIIEIGDYDAENPNSVQLAEKIKKLIIGCKIGSSHFSSEQ